MLECPWLAIKKKINNTKNSECKTEFGFSEVPFGIHVYAITPNATATMPLKAGTHWETLLLVASDKVACNKTAQCVIGNRSNFVAWNRIVLHSMQQCCTHHQRKPPFPRIHSMG